MRVLKTLVTDNISTALTKMTKWLVVYHTVIHNLKIYYIDISI